jgi:predicted histone-like DNA-binding protein
MRHLSKRSCIFAQAKKAKQRQRNNKKRIMSLRFTLRQNKIKSNKSFGKWYAHTLRGSEITLEDIARQVGYSCSVSKGDVYAVILAMDNVVSRALKKGHVINLGALGKFYLSIRGVCVDNPDAFSVKDHVKGVVCKYTPAGHRVQSLGGRISRPFTDDCVLEQVSVYDETGHLAKRVRRGGRVRTK